MTDAIEFAYRGIRTLADGTGRIQVDIEPRDVSTFVHLFSVPGEPGALVRLNPSPAKIEEPAESYGQQARILKQSSFFRTPDVWAAVGSDDNFLAWIRQQQCCVHGVKCSGYPVVAAHVRRVANGAGVGIKPKYSAVPLCDYLHNKQHQEGESVVMTPETWDQQRIYYVSEWAWEELKASLGYASWSKVPPEKLLAWAQKHGVEAFLPDVYRGV